MLYNKFICRKPFFISGIKYEKNFIIFWVNFGKFYRFFYLFIFKAFKDGSKGIALVWSKFFIFLFFMKRLQRKMKTP